jgi:hypothetical protein
LSSGLTSIFFAPTTFSNAKVQGSDFPRLSILLYEKKRGVRASSGMPGGPTFISMIYNFLSLTWLNLLLAGKKN